MIRDQVDIAILGAGFAGSLMAMILHQQGHRVVLIERGRHPRFSLGESSTPLAGMSLTEIAHDYSLPWLASFAKYGLWKAHHPDVVCGLKRGFTFVHHEAGIDFRPDENHSNELLVAASPADEVADTHWLRADFDAFLVEQAKQLGLCYLDQTEIDIVSEGAPWQLHGRRGDESVECTANFLIDATGPRSLLARRLGIDMAPTGLRTRSWSIYSHFENVGLWEEIAREAGCRVEEHPYRCDDAALHHVLEEGWMWVLRFDHGVTSVGLMLDGHRHTPRADLSPEEQWGAIVNRYSDLSRQFEHARPVRVYERTPLLQRRAARMAGPDWAMLAPSAYSLDALYSTGNAHALHSIQRLARILEQPEGRPERLSAYDETLQREIDFLDRLVDGTYRSFRAFGLLPSFAMYYFAGAITAEEMRSQGRATGHEEFLHSHDPAFRAVVERGHAAVVELARQPHPDGEAFSRQVARDLAPWNTVGLCDPRKRNMYPYG